MLHEATDQAAMFAPVVKDSFTVTSAEELPAAAAAAVRAPTRAPCRPVYLQVPTDLLGADVGEAGARRAAPRRRRGHSATPPR